MTFPTTNSLAYVWEEMRKSATTIKWMVDDFNIASAAGTVSGRRILNLFNDLAARRADMSAMASTTGLPAYAKDQMSDQSLDIVADYTTMQSALDAVTAWIIANAGGQLLMPSMDGQGVVANSEFTSVQTAPLRSALQSLSDTIG